MCTIIISSISILKENETEAKRIDAYTGLPVFNKWT